jgi:hypothetical protein
LDFWDEMSAGLASIGQAALKWIVLVAISIVIFFVGKWLIGLIRSWLRRIIDSPALRGIWQRSGVDRALEPTDQTPGSVLGTVAYVYLMAGLLLIIARLLEADPLEDLLTSLVSLIPAVLLAVAIVIIAAAVGTWLAGLVEPWAIRQNVPWLTTATNLGVVVFGVLFALDLLNIGFAEDVVKIIVAATAIALAIAFGVGGIDAARKWWARYGTPAEAKRRTDTR